MAIPLTGDLKFQGYSASEDGVWELVYIVRQTGDDNGMMVGDGKSAAEVNDVLTWVTLNTPSSIAATGGQRHPRPRIEEMGLGWWLVTVQYVPLELAPVGEDEGQFSFEIGGATQKILQSKESRRYYYRTIDDAQGSRSGSPWSGAIGVGDDGTVEGVDVPAGKYEFSETWFLTADKVDDDYIATLNELADGTYNDAPFKGLKAGECTFLGASGATMGQGYKITFKFAGSPNKPAGLNGLKIGKFTGIEKLGWDYVWVRFKHQKDGTNKQLVSTPEYVVVERVFDPKDYSRFKIGLIRAKR